MNNTVWLTDFKQVCIYHVTCHVRFVILVLVVVWHGLRFMVCLCLVVCGVVWCDLVVVLILLLLLILILSIGQSVIITWYHAIIQLPL